MYGFDVKDVTWIEWIITYCSHTPYYLVKHFRSSIFLLMGDGLLKVQLIGTSPFHSPKVSAHKKFKYQRSSYNCMVWSTHVSNIVSRAKVVASWALSQGVQCSIYCTRYT